jgi:hypothetical protein
VFPDRKAQMNRRPPAAAVLAAALLAGGLPAVRNR